MLRYALNEFRKNITMNLFLILQLTVTLVMAVTLTSILVSRYEYYSPFKNYLNKDGTYSIISPTNWSNLESVNNIESLKKISGVETVLGCGYPDVSDPSDMINVMSYTENVIDSYKPEILEGEWLSEASKQGEYYSGVVVENVVYGLGDVITLQRTVVDESSDDFNISYEPVYIKVTGVIKDGSKIFGKLSDEMDMQDNEDFRNLFTTYSMKDQGKIMLLMSYDEIAEQNVVGQTCGGTFLINVDDSLSESEKKEAMGEVSKLGSYIPLDEFNQNSLSYIYKEFKKLFPIFLCAVILVAVSAVSISAIYTKKQLRDYGIYYMCGGRWKDCSFISVIQAVLNSAAAVILCAAMLISANLAGILGETVISFGIWQLFSCVLILIFNLFISSVMPAAIIRKSPPREVIKALA